MTDFEKVYEMLKSINVPFHVSVSSQVGYCGWKKIIINNGLLASLDIPGFSYVAGAKNKISFEYGTGISYSFDSDGKFLSLRGSYYD